jgi:hypothetical protein
VIYDVEWLESAQREFDALWAAADDDAKLVISQALDNAIDRLTIAPYSQSEERTSFTARVLFALPLRIEFRMDRFKGALVVTHVRLVRKRGK